MSPFLRITRNISNDVWKILFVADVTKLTETDKGLMQKFGEPEINVGGAFLATTADAYTLPVKYVKVISGLPFTQEFDSTTEPFNTATQTKAEAFQAAFIEKYATAIAELRANQDTFTGETIVNI